MSLDRCRVVLVQPLFPGNLGAAARVMANMGLADLVLVNPVADPRDPRAREMSTHGEAILEAARTVDSFSEAVRDCSLVVGTSARIGGLLRRQTVGEADQIVPHIVDVLRQGHAAALVFGSETNGLPNDTVTRCHHLIHIDTDDHHSSLNLAQTVAICLYELRKAWQRSVAPTRAIAELAPVEEQERCFRDLESALREIHFLFGTRADALMHAIRHLLGKAKLTSMEVRILIGLARQIRWYVNKH